MIPRASLAIAQPVGPTPSRSESFLPKMNAVPLSSYFTPPSKVGNMDFSIPTFEDIARGIYPR